MTLRVLSLNAWGGRLHEPLLRYLKAVDADVVCLQEVVRTQGEATDWLSYRDKGLDLPQRANLFDEVCAVFPFHDAVFCPAERGLLHDGDRSVFSEFGLATFVRRSLRIVGQVCDFIHGDFSPDGWGPHPRARNVYGIRLFSRRHGFFVTIAHMHGLRDPTGKGNTTARDAQAAALTRILRTFCRKNERLVLCGDFNVLPDSRLFEALGEFGLRDLVTARGFADTRTSFYEKPVRFADYMLVTADVEVVDFDVVTSPEVSDHRALVLDMR